MSEKLNDELLQIAVRDFDEFCTLTNFDIEHAYVCMLKAKGKSYGQIGTILKKSKEQVRTIYRRKGGCNCHPKE